MAQKLTNFEMLGTPDHLLDYFDRQRKQILLAAAMRLPCPACGARINRCEAAGVDLNDYDADALREPEYRCPHCWRRLLRNGDTWVLVRELVPVLPEEQHG